MHNAAQGSISPQGDFPPLCTFGEDFEVGEKPSPLGTNARDKWESHPQGPWGMLHLHDIKVVHGSSQGLFPLQNFPGPTLMVLAYIMKLRFDPSILKRSTLDMPQPHSKIPKDSRYCN